MSDKDSGPVAGVKGVVEDVKGKAKEAVGAVTGNDELKQEGAAQQDKADAEREVALKEAEADKARAVAAARGRAAQPPALTATSSCHRALPTLTDAQLTQALQNFAVPGHDHFLTDTNNFQPEWWDVQVVGVTSPTYAAIRQHWSFGYIQYAQQEGPQRRRAHPVEPVPVLRGQPPVDTPRPEQWSR